MVVFALVNNQKSGGYYISSTRQSMGWQALPHDLADVMEDVRRKGEEVEEVSIGLDDDWFLRTNVRHACKTQHNIPGMVSNVELFAQLAAQGGLNLEHYAIQFFTFVPDPTGYVTVLHKGDRSLTRCAWHNVPLGLDRILEREAAAGVRHVTAGMNGSYVVILNSGVVWWEGVPSSLQKLLSDAEQKGRGVKTVSLSLVSAEWFFVEFADGATQYVLPPQWHGDINKHTSLSIRKQSGPTMVTSFNSTPSVPRPPPSPQPPPYGSHHGSFGFNSTPSVPHSPPSPHPSMYGSPGQFSPLSPHIPPSPHSPHIPQSPHSPHPVFGHTPYTPNPYVAPMYTGFPQFVPQPQPPPQLPTYNITNIYNNVQQPGKPVKPESHGHETVQLIGGALKVAAALLQFANNN